MQVDHHLAHAAAAHGMSGHQRSLVITCDGVGALKSGECDLVYRDIVAVTDACIERRVVCKVIIETALLTDEEKAVASQ